MKMMIINQIQNKINLKFFKKKLKILYLIKINNKIWKFSKMKIKKKTLSIKNFLMMKSMKIPLLLKNNIMKINMKVL